MNDELENEECTVLAEARGALAPTREQIERVFGATTRTLASADASATAASIARAPLRDPPPRAAGLGGKTRLVMLACVVAALGLGVYLAIVLSTLR